jgi:eukaryotic-like serine/threonine-protein kinase
MRISENPGPGRRLGRYELLRLIGEGGMAQVWAARMDGSRGFHKVVALKTLIPALARDPQFQRMFLDEANLASKIHHRNVVEIFDLGDTDGVLFLVMEWIDGQAMNRLLRPNRRALPLLPGVAARIVADAAHGLHEAHELRDERGVPLGIVHRDVCPQNILIDRDGTVKVADFGIVKAFERLGDTTQTGEIKGKGEYMSPEQAQSQPVDRRSDIFSLGVILFEAVTGAHPFQGTHEVVMMQQIVWTDPSRPSSIRPECPPELEAIILKALARDPQHRFQTADEMACALEDFLVLSSAAVTSAHVAEVLQTRCGDKMDDVRQNIAAAASPQRSQRWLPRPGAMLSAGSSAGSQPPQSTQMASDISAALGGSMRPSDVLRPLALPWLVAAISTGIATASLVFVALSRRPESLVNGPPRPATRALSTSEQPVGEGVRSAFALRGAPIALRVLPQDAVVRLDGQVIGVGDKLIARPAPGVSLSVSAESQSRGGATKTMKLTSDSPDRVELNLESETPSKETAPSSSNSGSTGSP